MVAVAWHSECCLPVCVRPHGPQTSVHQSTGITRLVRRRLLAFAIARALAAVAAAIFGLSAACGSCSLPKSAVEAPAIKLSADSGPIGVIYPFAPGPDLGRARARPAHCGRCRAGCGRSALLEASARRPVRCGARDQRQREARRGPGGREHDHPAARAHALPGWPVPRTRHRAARARGVPERSGRTRRDGHRATPRGRRGPCARNRAASCRCPVAGPRHI